MLNFIKKYKILLAVELLGIIACVVMWIGTSIKGEEVIYSKDNLYVASENSGFRSANIDLKAGVYQLRIRADIPEGSSLLMHVQQEGNPYHSLLSNEQVIFSGHAYMDYEVYALGKLDNARVTAQCLGTGEVHIESVELVHLNWGARILLSIVVAASVLFNVILYFRDLICEGKISGEKQVAFWLVVLGVFMAYFPYMTGYINLGDDSTFHLLRIEGLTDSIIQGARFPIKMQSGWLSDHGYAVSLFYGDLFLYLAVVLRLIGFTISTAFRFFVFCVTIATASIAYWSFHRMTANKIAAAIGAFFYVTAPYRLNNVYGRGALGEYLAMAFIPLIICGVYELYTKEVTDKKFLTAKYLLIIGLSGILQSHLLTCEMVVVFLLLIFLILAKKSFSKRIILEWVKVGSICLLINCNYWYPLIHMLMQDNYLLGNMANNTIQANGATFGELLQGFVGSGKIHMRSQSLGLLVLGMLLLGVVVWITQRSKSNRTESNPYIKQLKISMLIVLVTAFASTKYFPWDLFGKLPGVSFFVSALQFPYRFLSLATAFVAVFVVYFVMWLGVECRNRYTEVKIQELTERVIVTILTVIMLFSATYQVNAYAFDFQPVWLYNARSMGSGHVGSGEYLLEGTESGDYYYHNPVASSGLEWGLYEKKGTTIRISVGNTTKQEAYLELPVIGYNGYAIEIIDGNMQETPYITEKRGSHGDLRIAVPADYVGEIEISYKGHWSYRVAEAISLITLISLCGYGIFKRRKQWTAKS